MRRWMVIFLVMFAVEAHAQSRMRISFPTYDKGETLTNFPLLVVFSNGMANGTFDFSTFRSTSGYDLRFWINAMLSGSELNYEIETWNTATASYVWVQVPLFTNNCVIWASWGDKTNDSFRAYTTNGSTWSGGCRQVYHMGQTNAQDATVNKLNGSVTNAAVSSAGGIVGKALSFSEGGAGAVTLPFYDRNAAPYTLSAWAKTVDSNGAFISWMFYGTQDHLLLQTLNGKLRFYRNWWTSNSEMLSTQIVADGQWHYCVVIKATNDTGRLYVDGVQVASVASVGTTRAGGSSFIGRTMADAYGLGVPDDYYYNGVLDEVRVCDADRSSNWIWACYMSVASNSVFATYHNVQVWRGLVITVR